MISASNLVFSETRYLKYQYRFNPTGKKSAPKVPHQNRMIVTPLSFASDISIYHPNQQLNVLSLGLDCLEQVPRNRLFKSRLFRGTWKWNRLIVDQPWFSTFQWALSRSAVWRFANRYLFKIQSQTSSMSMA